MPAPYCYRVHETRRGYLFGILAYACWGFFPLYWKLLRAAGPVEILAHRVLWSAVFVTGLLAVRRHWSWLRPLLRQRAKLAGIALAAILISVNWGTYIYGVNTDRVVETSLGYFINPLVSVLLGVAVLRERLRRLQWIALGIGAVAVVVLTVDYGRPPYLALTLAVSFGLYGLIKKRLALPAAEGLFIESVMLAVPALAYLYAIGGGSFGHSTGLTVLLIGGGVATAVPLLLFAGAANRLPLSTLGLLQYLAPIIQLGCGVLVYGEPMPPARLAGFALVWLALVAFTYDSLRATRRTRAAVAAAEARAAAEPALG